MPGARRFRALRFTAKAGAIEDLVAPPYDVMAPEERAAFASRSPCNVVHLTLPEGDRDPSAPGSRYARARDNLAEWLADGRLVAEEEPSATVVQEVFDADGAERARTGVELALRLGEYGGPDGILAHERTLEAPKADRLELMRATRANLGPVFALVPDAGGELRAAIAECSAREPDFRVSGPDEATRRVWIERDGGRLDRLENALKGRHAVIADGHHRYETALRHFRERGSGAPPPQAETAAGEGSGYVLCHLVPVEDPGLVVLPTHRVVRPPAPFDPDAFRAALGERFDLEETSRERAVEFARAAPARGDGQSFVVAAGRPPEIKRAILRDPSAMVRRAPDRSEAWRRLDVPCLHLLVMEDILGITPEEVASGGAVSYGHSARSVMAAVEHEGVLGFILRPVSPEAVLEVASAGEKMPQKSTYFYPKVAAGFAMRLLG